MSLPSNDEPRSATAIDLPILGRIPVGGALMLLCSSFALAGFPLDDVWHRLFGQDVTLWGPTHIMMIAGAVLTIVAISVLTTEGERAAGMTRRGFSTRNWVARMSPVLACFANSSRASSVTAPAGTIDHSTRGGFSAETMSAIVYAATAPCCTASSTGPRLRFDTTTW